MIMQLSEEPLVELEPLRELPLHLPHRLQKLVEHRASLL